MNLRLLLLQRMDALRGAQRQILVSHPEIYPQIPVVGRPGIRLPYVTHFGLHYQIWPEKTVITMMPGVSWKTPNAELIATLERVLRQVQEVLGKTG